MNAHKIHITDIPAAEHIYCPSTGELCHIVCKLLAPPTERLDVVPTSQSLQVARIPGKAGQVFPPHEHNSMETASRRKGECWIVVQGAAEAHLYGIGDGDGIRTQNRYIKSVVLRRGDVLVTLRGGHGFRIVEDGTLIFETKSGPYQGVAKDKHQIQSPDEPREVSELWKHNDKFKKGLSQVRRPENKTGPHVPSMLGEGGERKEQTAPREVEVPEVRQAATEQPE